MVQKGPAGSIRGRPRQQEQGMRTERGKGGFLLSTIGVGISCRDMSCVPVDPGGTVAKSTSGECEFELVLDGEKSPDDDEPIVRSILMETVAFDV